MAPRVIRDLNVRDSVDIFLNGSRQIPLHDLHVVHIILNPEVGMINFVNQPDCVSRVDEIEPGNVTVIQRLNQ